MPEMPERARKVFVIGIGMGNPDTVTVAADRALRESELIIGSRRLIESLGRYPARKVALIRSDEIADAVRRSGASVTSIVMSGDIGCYSGATRLYGLLDGLEVVSLPGISALAYLCSRLRAPWHDAFVASAHGRSCNAVGAIQSHEKTFLLTGGESSPQAICSDLRDRGLGSLRVIVGERLSYPDERIVEGTATELADHAFGELSCMLALNEAPVRPQACAPHLPDDAFLRGRTPMTKEEVRELAVCKLRVRPDDTVWDIGAGTGSVTVELARAAFEGLVIAIERDEEALGLIARNAEAFRLPNVRIVPGTAPAALAGLPRPDRVFIGGSGGQLEAILAAAIEANPQARLCLTAITLETLATALAFLEAHGLRDVDIAQLSVAKARATGSSHLMMASNPVYLISAAGPETPVGAWA